MKAVFFWTVRTTTMLCLVVGLANIALAQPCQYVLNQEFSSPDPMDAGFATAVDIQGELVLIGAPNLVTGTGQVFLFDKNDGSLLQTFEVSDDIVSATYGVSVAISPNGAAVLIGDPSNDTVQDGAGRAYLFDIESGDAIGHLDIPVADIDPMNGGGFGSAVEISGEFYVVGATGAERAYLFNRSNLELVHTFTDPFPTSGDLGGGGDGFGHAVAIAGNRVVVGSPFDWSQNIFSGDSHVFDTETGQRLATIQSPIFDPGQFGVDVAVSEEFIVNGASFGGIENMLGPGQVHIYDAQSLAYLRTIDPPVGGGFGSSVALFGGRLVVGANRVDGDFDNVGQAYVFDAATGELLQTLDDPTPIADDQFGFAIATDGNSILVSSGDFLTFPGPGDASLFRLEYEIGDINRDGTVNLLDVAPFVDAISSGTYQCEADTNGDQSVDLLDVAGFITALSP